MLRGREFLPSDRKDSQPVAIINETLAKKLWPDEDALGQLLYLVSTNETPKLVIGIAHDAVYSELVEDAKQPKPFYYLPLSQLSMTTRPKGAGSAATSSPW